MNFTEQKKKIKVLQVLKLEHYGGIQYFGRGKFVKDGINVVLPQILKFHN